MLEAGEREWAWFATGCHGSHRRRFWAPRGVDWPRSSVSAVSPAVSRVVQSSLGSHTRVPWVSTHRPTAHTNQLGLCPPVPTAARLSLVGFGTGLMHVDCLIWPHLRRDCRIIAPVFDVARRQTERAADRSLHYQMHGRTRPYRCEDASLFGYLDGSLPCRHCIMFFGDNGRCRSNSLTSFGRDLSH